VTAPVLIAITLLAAFMTIGGWLGWQLLRQNGRVLLRLDELEKRLNQIEFGDESQPEGLPLDSAAPEFELPDLEGKTHKLADYRGQSLLLIFFNPECGFCREMALRWKEKVESRPAPLRQARSAASATARQRGEKQKTESDLATENVTSVGRPTILLVSTGGAEVNRKIFDEHPVNCPVLLQKYMEVSTAYKANGTPTGYLISAEGKIASELAIGADALLALTEGEAESREQNTEIEQERTARFSQRSLARSKIKRDGLKAGTRAPEFRLPRLNGRGDLSLAEFRGRKVLLVFSDPHCGPCQTLAPELEKFYRANGSHMPMPSHRPSPPGLRSEATAWQAGKGAPSPAMELVMISRGDSKENRAKIKEHGLTFPVVLQQQLEISRQYAMFATPIAYLIDEQGNIAQDAAVGTGPILILAKANTPALPRAEQPIPASG